MTSLYDDHDDDDNEKDRSCHEDQQLDDVINNVGDYYYDDSFRLAVGGISTSLAIPSHDYDDGEDCFPFTPSRIPCLADGISVEDEARLKELFSKLDRNDDGQICIEDLAKSFRELR